MNSSMPLDWYHTFMDETVKWNIRLYWNSLISHSPHNCSPLPFTCISDKHNRQKYNCDVKRILPSSLIPYIFYDFISPPYNHTFHVLSTIRTKAAPSLAGMKWLQKSSWNLYLLPSLSCIKNKNKCNVWNNLLIRHYSSVILSRRCIFFSFLMWYPCSFRPNMTTVHHFRSDLALVNIKHTMRSQLLTWAV